MKDTGIQWTDHTFNPWWGCQRVSPGCEHCYAETWDGRWGGKHWGPKSDRRFFGEAHWKEPVKWNDAAERAGKRARVFCASMADVFEDRRDLDEQRARLWTLIRHTTSLDWQLLTKRPENIVEMVPADWIPYPLRNVWLGTSVEDRKRKERIDELALVPAHTRFLSIEPLLEDLGPLVLDGIHWVIVGGESGPSARPCALEWIEGVAAQCQAASVPLFVKQLGSRPTYCRPVPGGRGDLEYEKRLRDHKGGDPAEWPANLRVRQFPEAR